MTSVPVLIWESESWEDRLQRFSAGSAESREGKETPEGPWPGGLGGACGWAGQWLGTERKSVLGLSGGREAPPGGRQGGEFPGRADPMGEEH